jgi:hypothetical protein
MIELLVVTAILTTLIGLGLFMSFDYYRRSLLNDERDLVVSLLLAARTRSLDNLFQMEHGVCRSGDDYVLFRGAACDPAAPTSELTPASGGVAVTGLDPGSPVVFDQLSGDAGPVSINLSRDGSVKIIDINNEGRIEW